MIQNRVMRGSNLKIQEAKITTDYNGKLININGYKAKNVNEVKINHKT